MSEKELETDLPQGAWVAPTHLCLGISSSLSSSSGQEINTVFPSTPSPAAVTQEGMKRPLHTVQQEVHTAF